MRLGSHLVLSSYQVLCLPRQAPSWIHEPPWWWLAPPWWLATPPLWSKAAQHPDAEGPWNGEEVAAHADVSFLELAKRINDMRMPEEL